MMNFVTPYDIAIRLYKRASYIGLAHKSDSIIQGKPCNIKVDGFDKQFGLLTFDFPYMNFPRDLNPYRFKIYLYDKATIAHMAALAIQHFDTYVAQFWENRYNGP